MKAGLRASSRRRFIRTGALAAGASLTKVPYLKALGYTSPNEKLNIAGIGAGGRSLRVLREAQAGVESVVALADVDWVRGAEGFEEWPGAVKYKDFRRMLDKEHKNIDAVVIGTPDHTHAVAALACMQLGKHVYVEKPLTRTPWEARLLTRAAERYDWVATQMGNQGYSHDATRVACEILWSGEIGDVHEVHAWTRPAVWPQGMTTVPAPSDAPDTLDWDLWLGPAAWRPYAAGDAAYRKFIAERAERLGRQPRESDYGFYLPFNWRGFYDFGSSLIGDWGVHILGPANWALQLSPESLISVECTYKDSSPAFTYPDELTLRYEFAARPGMPPVTVYWYHHKDGDAYTPPGMTVEQARRIPDTGPQVGPLPEQLGPRRGRGGPGGGSGGAGRRGGPAGRGGSAGPQGSGYNCIFVGSKGYLGTSRRGEGVGLLPGSRWAEYQLPNAYLARSPGASSGSNMAAHCRDWVRACKGGAPACSNFSIAGKYTEWLLLGAAAVHCEGKLLWDSAKGAFINNEDANRWIEPSFREGWEIDL